MTFLELQDLTLSWLDDPEAGYFTRPQVKRWLNNAQLEVQKKLLQAAENWYLTCATTTLVQGQDCYVLPPDFLKLHHLEVVIDAVQNTAFVLKHSTQAEADAYRWGNGNPATFFLEKDCLVLRPTPQTVFPLKLHYSYIVQDMVSDNEPPDVPEQYHEYLAVLATIDGKIKDDRDMTNILRKKEYYEKMLEKDAKQRLQDRPRRVVRTYDEEFGVMF